MILQLLCILFLIPAALVAFYYILLAFYQLLSSKEIKIEDADPQHSFAIVIPAHNEEQGISNTLKSCKDFDYPDEKYKVFVIADNCTDRTAEIARQNGAICFERFDEGKKGKGYALEWGFKKILPFGYDAVVVLDADCYLDNQSLRVFDYYVKKGEKVLQVNDSASNPDKSSMSYVVAVGNLIENRLFYAPKSNLGLAVLLRGTGMVFRSEVLEQHPWQTHSIVEDIEYTLELIKKGLKVRFLNEVKVLSEFPVKKDQLQVQRRRWAGNISFNKSKALRLIWEGLVNGRVMLIDTGWTLLVLSRPLVLLELFVAIILSFLSAWLLPGSFSKGLLIVSLAILLTQGIYFGIGIVLLGINFKRIGLLLKSPATIMRLIVISLMGTIRFKKEIWIRTPR